MVEESKQNVFLIQIDASSFAEFKISEFEISIFDCIRTFICCCANVLSGFHAYALANMRKPVSGLCIRYCYIIRGFSVWNI